MAVELTRRNWRTALVPNGHSTRVPPRVLVGIAAAIVAIVYTSVFIGMRNAQRDEDAAQRRVADAQALLSLPPVSADDLQQQLASASAALAAARADTAGASVDLSSDSATQLLVLHAQGAGLSVQGIDRTNPSSAKTDQASYGLQGVHITVDGTPGEIVAFLADMRQALPGLIPVLGAMALSEDGVAHADIVFNTFTKDASPTPAARAAATPGAKR